MAQLVVFDTTPFGLVGEQATLSGTVNWSSPAALQLQVGGGTTAWIELRANTKYFVDGQLQGSAPEIVANEGITVVATALADGTYRALSVKITTSGG